MKKAVVLLSGGMDSAVALAIARGHGFECHALSVRYGQRHSAELDAAARVARAQGAAGHAVVVVLHDLTLAARACDRIALMASGQLLAAGPPSSVLTPELLASAYAVPFDVIATPAGLMVAAS